MEEEKKAKHAEAQRRFKERNNTTGKKRRYAAKKRYRRATASKEERQQNDKDKEAQRKRKWRLQASNEDKEREAKRKKSKRQETKNKKVVPNFSTLVEGFDNNNLSFEAFEQDPECATMLFYLNLGYDRFSETNEEKLKKEIEAERCTLEEQDIIIDRFLQAQGRGGYQSREVTAPREFDDPAKMRPNSRDVYITTCGLCGIKQPESNKCVYTEVALADIEQFIALNNDALREYEEECRQPPLLLPINEENDLAEFHLYKLRSVYRSQVKANRVYYVHPEFVHIKGDVATAEYTYVCPDCKLHLDRMCIPPNSEAAGVYMPDFSRLPLTTPNLFELNILARYRMYSSVVKIQSNTEFGSRSNFTSQTLQGHVILFQHDAPDIALLPLVLGLCNNDKDVTDAEINDVLDRFLILNFVGPNNHMDTLMRATNKCLAVKGRAYVIYQWKSVLSHIHNQYGGDPPLPSFPIFKRIVDKFNKALMERAVKISDDEALQQERQLGDDVAKVRSTISRDHPVGAMPLPNFDTSLTYSCVRGCQDKTSAECEREFLEYLKLVAACFNIDADNVRQERRWESHRVDFPNNIYGTSDELLTGSFPHIFMYGVAYGMEKGCLNRCQLRHLLLHFTNVPATCKELYFYLFNEMLRHENIINTSAKIKSNPEAFESYAMYLNSQEFREEIKEALLYPSTDSAKKVLAKVAPIMSITRKNSVLGPLDNIRLKSELFALFRAFGPFCSWITIAPDDISNPTTFRLTLRSNSNFTIPAVVTDEFLEALRHDATVLLSENVRIPVGFSARAAATINNPVATSLEYINLLDNIYNILFGVRLADTQLNRYSKTVRTTYYKNNPKGLFGHVLAAVGITETQHRGALHTHVLLLGNLPPQLLQNVADNKNMVKIIADSLDSMYCAEVPRSYHVQHLLEQSIIDNPSFTNREGNEKSEYFVPAALRIPPNPIPRNFSKDDAKGWTEYSQEWKEYSSNNAIHKQLHDHTFTCHTGKVGEIMCCLLFERPLANNTRVVQLFANDDNDKDNDEYNPFEEEQEP